MPFKPFAHLARVSLAKGITHAYAPSAVVAGQSIGQFHNSSTQKFSKATHVQNAFSGPSSSGTGAGAKSGHATQSTGTDAGLAQYYAAWQHAQQTGDDTDWKQHLVSRKISWKPSEKTKVTSRPSHHRLDSIRAADLLRPGQKLNRGYSDTHIATLQLAEDNVGGVVASAAVDDTVVLGDNAAQATELDTQAIEAITSQPISDSTLDVSQDVSPPSESLRSPSSTTLTSPATSNALTESEDIVELGRQHRYADIPQRFESMIREGLVPTVDAYNQIITSSIRLSVGYQPYSKALDIYGDMTKKLVLPNRETYSILISYLTQQSLEAIRMRKDLAQQQLRYGLGENHFVLPSLQRQLATYSEDTSLKFATKFYNIASASAKDFRLSTAQFNQLLQAHAQNGNAQDMRQIALDMEVQRVPMALELYTVVIDACASIKDIEGAKAYYAEYRDRAIGRTLEPLDVEVYMALIRAYYATGEGEKGTHFYQQILASFEGTADKSMLTAQVTDAFVVDGLVQHYVDTAEFSQALNSTTEYALSTSARIRALNKICVAAADKNETSIAADVFASLNPIEVEADCAMAVAAMHFRAGNVAKAQSAWNKVQQFRNAPAPNVYFGTMLGLSYISAGMIEDGLAQVRAMFRQIRSTHTSPQSESRLFDEVITVFNQTLLESSVSSQATLQMFRLMIENGGLVPHVTQDAIARLGPECVQQLNPQDIALALHVQAYMLPSQNTALHDSAQAERFAHLLETVLERGILMDPSTLHAISDALPRLRGMRPDLERRWNALISPAPQEVTSPRFISPVTPHTPVNRTAVVNNFDPYANTTDHRASRVISEMLESSSGRLEHHIANAMARLRNVRRMGRHLQYSAYARLITAAGKAKQSNLMQEILGMAQTDVPFNAQIPAVKTGWVTIYDSMIAAYLTIGERQLAAKFHNDIRAMGEAPSANTFGIYITTLEGTFDEATEAVKIFQQALSEGVTPSVFLYNAVIGKLGKARRIDDCLQYFAQMQNLGIKPSSVTYGTLVNALCRTSEEKFAVEMFDEMEAQANYKPRPAPYNSIIQYFLNTKRDRSEVLQYYGRMRRKGIKPTSHTYKLLIEAYATLEPINLTAAETVLEDMKVNGVQPEAVHYGSLIHARGCVMHDMATARKVFDAVLADTSIRSTDNLYQNLLEAMVANHQAVETEEVLADMKKRGIGMTPYIANCLIHGWAGEGNIEKARSIYESLGAAQREPSTYEAMTRAFIAAEDRAGAQAVVAEMLQKGYPSAVSEKVLALIGN